MLLEHVRIEELEDHLAAAMDAPVWPGMHHQRDRAAIRERAKAVGLWDRLAEWARPEPIEVLPRSLYRQYRREGIREPYMERYDARTKRATAAAYAVWLDHPIADLDYVQDLLWEICERTTWVMPAHEGAPSGLELGSTRVGLALAEIAYLLQDDLEAEVHERVAAELNRRMLDPTFDWRRPSPWATRSMNWNHVCNSNLIQIALYCIDEPLTLANFIHPLIQRMNYALNGFASDGGCLEGPSYWVYGFGHYVQAALAVHQRTGGRINLMDDPRIEPICRYPLAVHFDAQHRLTVGDAMDGYLEADIALQVNHLCPVPELYALTPPRDDCLLDVQTWRGLALYDGKPVSRERPAHDVFLPDTALVRVVAADDPQTQLAVTARNNGMPHNHNDVGSFLLFKHGRVVLTDPGAPRYTRRAFSPQRYELIHTRSLGHSVPIIEGQEQPKGAEYAGSLHVENLTPSMDGHATASTASLTKTIVAEIGGAYALPKLRALKRTFELLPDGELHITDHFAFTEPPASLDEGFVSFDEAAVLDDGRAVRFGAGETAVTLQATPETAGTFQVHELSASVEDGRDGRLLRRVTFTPAALTPQMTLSFVAR